jgi:hypothetical protein
MIVSVRGRVASSVAGKIGRDDSKFGGQKRSYIEGPLITIDHQKPASPPLGQVAPTHLVGHLLSKDHCP